MTEYLSVSHTRKFGKERSVTPQIPSVTPGFFLVAVVCRNDGAVAPDVTDPSEYELLFNEYKLGVWHTFELYEIDTKRRNDSPFGGTAECKHFSHCESKPKISIMCPDCRPYDTRELFNHDDFYYYCSACAYSIAICPDCGKKMIQKFSKCLCDTEIVIYQCEECKNIEVHEE